MLAHSLADVLRQYREIGRLLDAKAAHERAERAEQAARQEVREKVATAAPVVPARGQDGPLRRASAHDGGSDHPRGDAFDAGVAVIDWPAVSAARLAFVMAECLPDVVKPCSRPADPMRYQHATDGEQTRPTHSGGPKSGHLYQGQGETRGADDCS